MDCGNARLSTEPRDGSYYPSHASSLLIASWTGVWFLHTKAPPGAEGAGRQQQRRRAALGLPALYGFDYVDHSAIEVAGRIYDATYGVEAESWSDYMALMVRFALLLWNHLPSVRPRSCLSVLLPGSAAETLPKQLQQHYRQQRQRDENEQL